MGLCKNGGLSLIIVFSLLPQVLLAQQNTSAEQEARRQAQLRVQQQAQQAAQLRAQQQAQQAAQLRAQQQAQQAAQLRAQQQAQEKQRMQVPSQFPSSSPVKAFAVSKPVSPQIPSAAASKSPVPITTIGATKDAAPKASSAPVITSFGGGRDTGSKAVPVIAALGASKDAAPKAFPTPVVTSFGGGRDTGSKAAPAIAALGASKDAGLKAVPVVGTIGAGKAAGPKATPTTVGPAGQAPATSVHAVPPAFVVAKPMAPPISPFAGSGNVGPMNTAGTTPTTSTGSAPAAAKEPILPMPQSTSAKAASQPSGQPMGLSLIEKGGQVVSAAGSLGNLTRFGKLDKDTGEARKQTEGYLRPKMGNTDSLHKTSLSSITGTAGTTPARSPSNQELEKEAIRNITQPGTPIANVKGGGTSYLLPNDSAVVVSKDGQAAMYEPGNTTKKMADLSNLVYSTTPSNLNQVIKLPDGSSATVIKSYKDKDGTGFQATAYRLPDGRVVVAYAGTNEEIRNKEGVLVKDGAADRSIAFQYAQGPDGKDPLNLQVKQARMFFNDTAKDYGSVSVVTGHSLGGALAQVVGAEKGVSTETINAPGMATFIQRFQEKNPDYQIKGTDKIINHIRKTDIVGHYDQHLGNVIEYSKNRSADHGGAEFAADLKAGMSGKVTTDRPFDTLPGAVDLLRDAPITLSEIGATAGSQLSGKANQLVNSKPGQILVDSLAAAGGAVAPGTTLKRLGDVADIASVLNAGVTNGPGATDRALAAGSQLSGVIAVRAAQGAGEIIGGPAGAAIGAGTAHLVDVGNLYVAPAFGSVLFKAGAYPGAAADAKYLQQSAVQSAQLEARLAAARARAAAPEASSLSTIARDAANGSR